MKRLFLPLALGTALLSSNPATATDPQQLLKQTESKVIEWRRHLHQYPELGNREFKTAKYIEKHLRSLGMEVETGVAHTGVVALLKGGNPGPTVALRADMDALPVAEQVDIPFASKVKTEYNGEQVGVMHACGHDTHVAMLMGAAEVLAAMRNELNGNVLFVFQPAEEGAPDGEEGGAELMLKEGLFEKYKPQVAFGQHVTSTLPSGVIGYRSGPLMASSDEFRITVKGRQTHGSRPWGGVDPITAAAQIVMGTQTIVSRQIDISKEPAVVSFGKIAGGVRNNIIPDSVFLNGTIRNFDMDNRQQIFKKLKTTAERIAESSGAEAEVEILEGYPVTVNNPALTEQAVPVLKAVAGDKNVMEIPKITGAEDFSFFALEVPGFYYFLGVTPAGTDPATAASNHSPRFYVDETALKTGTEAITRLTLNYLSAARGQ
ncbi:M20 family metallopeptidase [Microbulbifer thermotolerans]|uniref:N-acyl-L-amino acid amidohydrolase n=1 Tax=Microbulbifer thermotolerans TaxID=252514 RepID=A0A143HQ02_MICTH|nr:M20 family metallopeptidase [Microbulbifer thermotolerans]AMX03500.1 N-acyl-L-amino acid amidohydrolase [Microbulbifer thermotolerans]MCX2781106.1 M20 family metallopeptidase [Microbulbifer thermotolerans]MCX2804464.1 M20 family metallopeptidase [Microbulbifer thermotolerans]MCX2832346.1 M20 family metallopeptidase [Microbulbifer thermotolerans]